MDIWTVAELYIHLIKYKHFETLHFILILCNKMYVFVPDLWAKFSHIKYWADGIWNIQREERVADVRQSRARQTISCQLTWRTSTHFVGFCLEQQLEMLIWNVVTSFFCQHSMQWTWCVMCDVWCVGVFYYSDVSVSHFMIITGRWLITPLTAGVSQCHTNTRKDFRISLFVWYTSISLEVILSLPSVAYLNQGLRPLWPAGSCHHSDRAFW